MEGLRTLRNVRLGFALLGSSLISASAFGHAGAHLPVNGKVQVMTVQLKDYRKELNELVSKGFDIGGVDFDKKRVDLILNADGFKHLPAFVTPEVSAFREMDVTAAPDSSYRTPAEAEAEIRVFAERYPDLVAMESIGKTEENRDIWAVKVTSPAVAERGTGKPNIYFNSLHHAREVMTTEVGLDIIDYLTKNYATDPTVRGWLDNNVIWVIPMLNPDGSNKVWTSNNMWRKNAKGGYGVDVNRNYPYKWNSCKGSSGSQNADDFRGESAGSELETKAIMSFVRRIQPVFSISFHSYSELVLYPYGCDGERTPTRDLVEGTGKQIAALLPKDGASGTYKPGTPWEILYAVDGGDIDWMYNNFNIVPYVIELNSTSQGFQPSFTDWRNKTVTKARAAWGFLLNRLDGSGIRAAVRNSSGQPITNAQIVIRATAESRLVDQILRVKPDGTFHVALLPGAYKMIVTVNGQMQEQNLMIGSTRQDFELVF